MTTRTETSPIPLVLRFEGLAVLGVASTAFFVGGGSVLWFFALLLLPDLSMLGYLAGKRVGAIAYNTAHNYLLPIGLGAAGYMLGQEEMVRVALIWVAHIGADRLFGYGLKYAEGFRSTHLGRL